MDAGTIRGIGTLLLLMSFVGLCVWAWMPSQRRRFEEAASLAFLDDDGPSEGQAGRKVR